VVGFKKKVPQVKIKLYSPVEVLDLNQVKGRDLLLRANIIGKSK